ncbi:diguanylate cyclase [Candidatus Parabeggiatoa sp. HSG14]|uniref:diguanylate cyclase domain-containing protein n=1 Tax=Candidatus Parabeggiatoa sp. HSG14 TaxID=3055593 RepID=UPI0025A9042E|nr:diguanylate cyclase [Thiotrichales bacterium HSG14]
MANKSKAFTQELTALRQNFKNKLPGRVANLHNSWETLQTDWQPDILFECYREVHTLSGSSSTFGFVQIGEITKQLEKVIKSVTESDKQPNKEQSQQMIMLLNELKLAVETKNNIDLPQDEFVLSHQLDSCSPTTVKLSLTEEPPLIYLVEDEIDLATHISKQIETFGYSVNILTCASELLVAIAQKFPQAIIMDIILPEGEMAGPKMIEEIQQKYHQHIPLVFISAKDDLEARLAAIQVGGNAYMTKPINVSMLIERLDMLIKKTSDEPYRIFIVDDDAEIARHHAIILENAGMEVQTCIEPVNVLEKLRQFLPDFILMDIYMPKCTGNELTQVIRQLDVLPGIPIVYLSSEYAMDKQLNALLQGGDGFLTKPILANTLIRVVSYHVKRFRQLHSLMVRDSLTGLLNHSHILEQLNIEVGRANRTNTPLSFVMLDLDHFKQINDTYGHSIGDIVLKTLARFLKQRFRFTDYIGRCGGEEFAIILPNTDGLTAKKIIEISRDAFSQVSHQAQEQKFQITFSSGIAYYPKYLTAKRLIEAADAALYDSKNAGRNRVTLKTT